MKPIAQPTIRHEPRRGIILIFVVVLLVLLAVMGTAYLASSRADRVQLAGRGAAAGAQEGLLADRTTLRHAAIAIEQQINQRLIEDLFYQANYANARSTAAIDFRRPRPAGGAVGYFDYDAYGPSDPHLASLLPELVNPNFPMSPSNPPMWRWISSPLELPNYITGRGFTGTDANGSTTFYVDGPQFADPRVLLNPGLRIGAQAFNGTDVNSWGIRSGTFTNRPGDDRTRIYPMLTRPGQPTDTNAGNWFIAADASSDGIADAGLSPLAIQNPAFLPADTLTLPITDYRRYEDPRNPGVVYFYACRIVDNSAKVNVNTAFSVTADFRLPDAAAGGDPLATFNSFGQLISDTVETLTPPPPPPPDLRPNFGFFKSNVGLIELLRPLKNVYPDSGYSSVHLGSVPTPPSSALEEEIRRILAYRISGPDADVNLPSGSAFSFIERLRLGNTVGIEAKVDGVYRPADFVEFATLGGALETAVARRPLSPGDLSNFTAAAYGDADAATLHYRDGLVKLSETLAQVDRRFAISATYTAPNFTSRRDPESLKQTPSVWPGDFYADTDNATDFDWFSQQFAFRSVNPSGRPTMGLDRDPGAYDFDGRNSYLVGGREFARSIRPLLTVSSGTTTGAPVRNDNALYDAMQMPRLGAYQRFEEHADPAPSGPPYGAFPAAKVSAISGTVRELFRAYWNAMTELDGAGNLIAARQRDADGNVVNAAFPAKMFNRVDRGTSSANDLDKELNVAAIRAALAAVNTADLRDLDDDVTEFTFNLPVGGKPVTVFGGEPQIWVTDVWVGVRNEPTATPGTPQVTVVARLYNPHDRPVSLVGYRMQAVDHTGGALSTVGSEIDLSDWSASGLPSTMAPGDVRFLYYADQAGSTLTLDPPADIRDFNFGRTKFVNAFATLLGTNREIWIGRTRRADGVASAGEVLTDIRTLVPIDMFNLRDVDTVNLAPDSTTREYRFAGSPNESDQNDWLFISANDRIGRLAIEQDNPGKNNNQSVPLQLQNFRIDDGGQPANLKLPFNAFPHRNPIARDGDLTKVPFIGSYVLKDGASYLEMTCTSIDTYLSDLPETPSSPAAAIGRFVAFDDNFSADDNHYRWTNRVFEFVTANDTVVGDVVPAVPDVGLVPNSSDPTSLPNPPGDVRLSTNADYVRVLPVTGQTRAFRSEGGFDLAANDSPSAQQLTQGKINVNTAPIETLRLLPWVVNTATGVTDPAANGGVANSIATDRRNFGAFTSLFDLTRRVPSLRGAGLSFVQGDLSADDVTDFEDYYGNITRVSNLASVRSDSYTVYLVVQAWRTAGNGDNNARLIDEIRKAYIVDRSGITANSASVSNLRIIPIEEQGLDR